MKVKISTRYDYESIDSPGIMFDPNDPKSKSLTLQSGKDEADINFIMDRYEKTGYLGNPMDNVSSRIPQFGDFSDIGDFHAVMIRVADLNSQFMLLPAKVRARFNHDPKAMLDFMADPKNEAECVSLGLKMASKTPNVSEVAGAGAPATPAPTEPSDNGSGGSAQAGTASGGSQ